MHLKNLSIAALILALILQTFSAHCGAAEWKPAKAPLMTEWGAQVTPENAHQDYPRPQMVRAQWTNLNGLWDYAITAKTVAAAPAPAKWDGKILVPFCVESALGGVGRKVTPDQVLWYQRTFTAPALPKGHRLLIHFDAVDWHSKLFVNDKPVGEHLGGNTPFSLDITDALASGGGGEQKLTLWVWDPTDTGSQPRGKQVLEPKGIWYTAVTGIWQTVWLEAVPARSIQRLIIKPNVDESTVSISADVRGDASTLRLRVTAAGIQSNTTATQPNLIAIAQPKLWSPDSPNLYDVKVELLEGNTVLDTVTSYFALRKIEMKKDAAGINRLFLNNQPLFQYGTLDQGWWPDGLLTPPSTEAMKYDIRVLKQLGFNMLRKHIKIEPARYYRACDELGILVWQDQPSGMSGSRGPQHVKVGQKQDAPFSDAEKKQFRSELQAMVEHLRHFPCIVVWVPFNEGWGQHDTNDILKWTISLDPTRLVNGPSGWEDRGFGHLYDMHKYPGPGMFPTQPDRISVLGEFGGLGLPTENHLWQQDKNWGYKSYKSTQELHDAYAKLLAELRPLIEKGLSAAVYTQTTDVEIEVNGLITYDRKVIKLDPKTIHALTQKLYAPVTGK